MTRTKSDYELQNARWLNDLDGLIGPWQAVGDCLEPEFRSGTLYWIDPQRAPVIGDLVCFRWRTDAAVGSGVATGGVKRLVEIDGKRYLEGNDGAVPVDSLPKEWLIVGPIVATLYFRHPPPELAEHIDLQELRLWAETALHLQVLKEPDLLDVLPGARRYAR